MQVQMTTNITGTRDGEAWPAVGDLVELPDLEAERLVAAGLACLPAAAEQEQDGQGTEAPVEAPAQPEPAPTEVSGAANLAKPRRTRKAPAAAATDTEA